MKNRIRFFAGLIALLICCTPMVAMASAVPGGIEASGVEAFTDEYVEEHRETTAAASIACFTAEDVIFDKYYGFTDIEGQVLNSADAVMEWGSISKLLTWVSVMQLSEAGQIDLESDIQTYLPEGFLTKLRFDTPVTMKHLMNHTGGWENTYPGTDIPSVEELMPLEEALRYFEPVQQYEPGATVCYSNWGAALAGYIVERVSGMDFTEYVWQNIFAPLGMKHTSIAADLSDNEWVKEKRAELECYYSDNEPIGTSQLYLNLYPCGSVTGTLSDLVKFAQALLDPASALAPLDEMYGTTLCYPDGSPRNAHGFWVLNLGRDILIHGGNMSGTSAMLALDIEGGMGTAIMTNQASEQVYCYDYVIELYGGWRYTESTAQNAQALRGVYMDTKAPQHGYMKLDMVQYMLPFLSGEGNTVSVPLLGLPLRLVDDGKLILDYMGTDMLAYLDELDGHMLISTSSLDYVKLGTCRALLAFGSLVLLIVVAIGCSVGLVVGFVQLIRKKERTPLSLPGGLLKASGVLTLVDLAALYAIGNAGTGGDAVTMLCLFSVVLCALALWYAVKAISMFAKKQLSGKALAGKIPMLVVSLTVVLNILQWQMYRFW